MVVRTLYTPGKLEGSLTCVVKLRISSKQHKKPSAASDSVVIETPQSAAKSAALKPKSTGLMEKENLGIQARQEKGKVPVAPDRLVCHFHPGSAKNKVIRHVPYGNQD